jgi:hypothetical protein
MEYLDLVENDDGFPAFGGCETPCVFRPCHRVPAWRTGIFVPSFVPVHATRIRPGCQPDAPPRPRRIAKHPFTTTASFPNLRFSFEILLIFLLVRTREKDRSIKNQLKNLIYSILIYRRTVK